MDEYFAGISEEFSGVALGDSRRDARLKRIAERLQANPSLSFPEAMKDGAELEGLYRFFSNDAVTPEDILAPHTESTVLRIAAGGTALAIHDSTEFRFAGSDTRAGAGRLREGAQEQGFLGHFSIAVSADGCRTPLGTLNLVPLVRDAPPTKKKPPIDDRESAKWGQGILESELLAGPHAKLTHVMDREADIYRLLADLTNGEIQYVVRSAYDRALVDSEDRLHDAAVKFPDVLERSVPISARPQAGKGTRINKKHPPREERIAQLAISASPVTLKRSSKAPKSAPEELTVNGVRVYEPFPPEGEAPIEWLLFTSHPITSRREVEWIVDAYRARWVIEEFFKALKTGCAYESRQLESLDALLNALAMFSAIAWRMLRIRSAARDPATADRAASEYLDPVELKVLRATSRRVKLSAVPTVREALWAIAGLGGHLKNNGEPGWLTILRGYRALLTSVAGWRAALSQEM